MSRRSSCTSSVSAYSGRTFLGRIDHRGDDFIAITPNGVVIGTFPSLREAADALEGVTP